MDSINLQEVIRRVIKYLVEGLAVGVAAYYIPRRTMDLKEIGMIAITASAIFAILDLYSPAIGVAARQGAGFGIGAQQVGFSL